MYKERHTPHPPATFLQEKQQIYIVQVLRLQPSLNHVFSLLLNLERACV